MRKIITIPELIGNGIGRLLDNDFGFKVGERRFGSLEYSAALTL